MKTSLWLCLTLGLLTAHTVYAAAIDEMNDLDYEYDGDEAIDQVLCCHAWLTTTDVKH